MPSLISTDIPDRCYLANGHDSMTLPRCANEAPRTIRVEDILDIGYTVPDQVRQSLRRVSQFGLKEIWLGGSPAQHNRWDHSVGAFVVGVIWLHVLKGRVPKHCLRWPFDSWEKIHATLGTSLLLHDYGHLPFAHMMDEVLQNINWLPQGNFHGLEAAVVEHRFSEPAMDETWKWLAGAVLNVKSKWPITQANTNKLVQQFIVGAHGAPWLQAIVNSPIDADKIDYLRYDGDFLRKCSFPVHHRLLLDEPSQWLSAFLADQEVNHAGLLCLHGRSAAAAADLWRERVFLYDRLYLAPDLRVPERMALEIVQQFLIRSTMSTVFLKSCSIPDVLSFSDRLIAETSHNPNDVLRLKYETVRDTMLALLPNIKGTKLEFSVLKRMIDAIASWPGIDRTYRDFLKNCFSCLEELNHPDERKVDLGNQKGLRDIQYSSLVREPILFAREDYEHAREILRLLQHYYARELLIDLVRLPWVLAGPRGPSQDRRSSEYRGPSILVPKGPIATWGPGKRAAVPLTDEVVATIERPYCRLLVIAPGMANSPRGAYLWDRVRSVLLEGNIQLIERREDE